MRRLIVLPGEGGGDYMAATTKGHERPKALHNFGLLNWGTQTHMRCVKLEFDDDHQRLRRHRRSSPSQFDGAAPSRFGGGFERNRSRARMETAKDGEEEGIEEFREKIMSDLRTVADKLTKSILGKQASGGVDQEEEEEEEEENRRNDKERRKEEELETRETEREVSPPEAPGTAAEAKPWNLRRRREASCKAPIPETVIRRLRIIEEKPEDPSVSGNKPRRRLTSVMSKKEIEDDFMKMIGQRPSRRPKKRPRTIQKQINMLHPAYYMYDITEDLYKITESEENRKR